MDKLFLAIILLILSISSFIIGASHEKECISTRYLKIHPLEGDNSYEDYEYVIDNIK